MPAPEVSIVVPAFNEAENLDELTSRLGLLMGGVTESYEFILVDDGSSDSTWEKVRDLARGENSPVRGLKLSRNFGHQVALAAGLRVASGEAVVTMDADLQHPPEVVPELIRAWRNGFKVVATRRTYPKETTYFKKASSEHFYRIFSFLADVRLTPGSSDFRLVDREVLELMSSFQDPDLFWRGIVGWLGFEEYVVEFEAAPRYAGRSKYSLKKMCAFATGALVSFSTKPLVLGILMGVLTSALAFVELCYTVVMYIRGETVPGWASTVGIISLLLGIVLVVLGVIGVYIGKIHLMLQARPRYIVSERVGDY